MSEIRRAVVKSYDAAAHKAAVQIAGSLAVWLDGVRVATNIPPADVAAGRQCTVLFLDPSNQDEAVIIAVQGALPSVGEILIATATADLTLTTSAQSITGDGDSSKVRIILPTPGDWIVEATCSFQHTAAGASHAIAELFVNDSGSAQTGESHLQEVASLATVAQRWKVTTTATDTPVELKARKAAAGGTVKALSTHTRITATGVKRSTGGGGGVTDHGALTGLSDPDHSAYGPLAGANTWAALQTFGAGLQLDAGQAVKDSGGTARYTPATSSPHNLMTGDVRIDGRVGVNTAPAATRRLKVVESGTKTATLAIAEITSSSLTLNADSISLDALVGTPLATIASGKTGINLAGLNFSFGILGGAGGAVVARAAGIDIRHVIVSWSGTINELVGARFYKSQLSGAGSVSAVRVVDIGNFGDDTQVVDWIGLKIDYVANPTGNIYALDVDSGSAGNPLLRVLSGAAPGANQTNVYISEGTTPTIRRVQWKDGASVSAGDKVMVLV